MGDGKKNAVNIRQVINIAIYDEKLAIASYNNPYELLNQRLEVLNVCRHKQFWLLGR